MKIALIPCGQSNWHGQGRLLGRVELTLTPDGAVQCGEWVAALEPLDVQRILHAPDELATQTAACVARKLSVPTKAFEDLVEVDVGLWAGLTESQLKSRYPSAHRELKDDPLNVHPPGGEDLSQAAERLNACIRKQLRKNGSGTIGVVLRPLLLAMARSTLQGQPCRDLWDTARQLDGPQILDLEETAPVGPTQ